MDALRRNASTDLINEYCCVFAIALVTGNENVPSANRLVESAFGAPSVLNAALYGLLVRTAERHRWGFAAGVQWSAVFADDCVIDDVSSSIWLYDPAAAAKFFVAAIGRKATLARRLPPKPLRSLKTISVWQMACRESTMRDRLMLSSLLNLLEQGARFLTLHRPLRPHELYEIRVFLSTAGPHFPELCSWYASCLARKLNEDGLPDHALSFYWSVLRDEDPRYAPLDFVFNSAANAARTMLSRHAEEWSDHRLFDPAELRTLILLCIPTLRKVEGVLLCECLRIISTSDAIFAAWACLCLDAPEWSDVGFRRLTYVNPATIAGFPMLVDWPARRPSEAVCAHFRRRAKVWPRISIVVPSYEQGCFIEQTIQSIVNQGYPDVEIIVEDGGSSDSTLDVLERWRPHLASVRSGRDEGQSDAIMRGFAKATGSILSWLNSDDLLAPFALFHVAEAMMDGADLAAGACFEFKGLRFIQANLPATPSGILRTTDLADLRDKWFMGHFFYQPEVFFSADLYARAGGYIDKSLNYTMDYDLWMRFAAQEPHLEKVFWPVALFRRHEDQKTSNLDRTVIEQGRTRRRYAVAMNQSSRHYATRDRLMTVLSKPNLKLHVVSGKVGIFFPTTVEADLTEAFRSNKYQVTFSSMDAGLVAADCDLVIHINTLMETERVFMEAIQAHPANPIKLGWFWDNHHAFRPNLDFALRYDIGIAGHDFARDYLANDRMWLLPSVPLCFTQWSAQTLESGRELLRQTSRINQLQGGFVDYPDVPARSQAIRKLAESGLFDGLRLINTSTPGGYFDQTTQERLATWCSHKVSLAANVERDIPIRFFDALVLGQIPIIPRQTLDLPWFDARFPGESYVVCESLEVPDVERAWKEALSVFDREGADGLRARTERSAARHSFAARLRELLAVLEAAVTESGHAA